MTAALAIAATSEVLRYIVEDAMVRAGQAMNFGPPAVTVGPPPKPLPAAAGGQGVSEPPAVNIFLHHVAPNPAWRNMHSPERDRQGRRLNNAPLVLDLHYLLSAHGTDIDREIGFGTAMHALHQTAIVPVALVKKALAALAGDASPLKKILAKAGLAEQFESLTVTPQTLDIDAVTKIWNAAQAPYRPSTGYLVTTVFLEDQKSATEPLPITSAPGIGIVPLSLVSIESASGLKNDGRVPITAGVQLDVAGSGLAMPDLAVTLDGAPLVVDGGKSGPQRLVLFLPADLMVGPHYLEIARIVSADGRTLRLAAAATSITLLPRIVSVTAGGVTSDGQNPAHFSGTLKLKLGPVVKRSDTVSVRLASLADGSGQEFTWTAPDAAQHPDDTFTEIDVNFAGLLTGTYIVGVTVNGVASQPEPMAGDALGPRITL